MKGMGQVPTTDVPFPESGVSTRIFPIVFFIGAFALYLWYTRG
jgi:hypothetical protein